MDQKCLQGAAFAVGICLHVFLFSHGEWHLRVRTLVFVHTVIFTIAVAASFANGTFKIGLFLLLSAEYFLGLFSSITIYRLFFHRLRSFPGPRSLATSKLWHVWQSRHRQNHLILHRLYKKYGPIVRTGRWTCCWREDSRQVETLTVSQAPLRLQYSIPRSKTFLMDNVTRILDPKFMISFIQSRRLYSHARMKITDYVVRHLIRLSQRKVCFAVSHWISNIVEKICLALESYVPALQAQVSSLQETIDTYDGLPVPVDKLIYQYTMDTMGHVVFPDAYETLPLESRASMFDKQERALGVLGIVLPAPWLAIFALKYLPRVWRLKDWHEMDDTAAALIQRSLDVSGPCHSFTRELETNKSTRSLAIPKAIRRWSNGSSMSIRQALVYKAQTRGLTY